MASVQMYWQNRILHLSNTSHLLLSFLVLPDFPTLCLTVNRKRSSPLLLSLILRGSWVAIASRFCCNTCWMSLCWSSPTIIILFSWAFSVSCSWAAACSAACAATAWEAIYWLPADKGRLIWLGRQLDIMGASGKKIKMVGVSLKCSVLFTHQSQSGVIALVC